MEFRSLTLALLGVVLLLICLQRIIATTYWQRRGVIFEKPSWIHGNLTSVGKTITIREPFRDFYAKYKGSAKFVGFYFKLRKMALLLDLDLIKLVLIKDFNSFAHRGNYYNEEDDPISAHLFNLDGQGWRDMRNKLTPTFTGLKMQQMASMIVEVADRLVTIVQREMATAAAVNAAESPVELKDLLARFTTDVIGSCAFGLDCNSLADPEVEFRVIGRDVFSKRRHGLVVWSFLNIFPRLCRSLHIKFVADNVSEFYTRIVRETIEYREKHQIQRQDFLNMLMELRQNGILTFNQIVAQSFVFFLAGFETSSSTMTFVLYLLALNQHVQQRARAEVQQVYAKHGQLNYEAMKELKYVQQIIHETLRMYSIAPIVVRQAVHDYAVPGTRHVIEAGMAVIIPIDAIHYNPDIYPEPERFDPERFAPEAVEQRHAMSWLPFGIGPRNCIGLRFGEMQAVLGLAVLLKHFQFLPSKETPIPLKLDKNVLVASMPGMVLNVQPVQPQ